MPSLIQVVPHIKSGRLRVLGTSGTRRSAVLPDVPTISESGVPGYEAHNWWGILAPAGTPAPVIEKLHRDLTRVLASRETEKRFETEGAEVVRLKPAALGRFISPALARWSSVARAVGIKTQSRVSLLAPPVRLDTPVITEVPS